MRGTAWPRDIRGAKALQESLRKRVRIEPLRRPPELIAGADAAFSEDIVIAVISLFTYPDLIHIEDAIVNVRSSFPYVPGFLSFKEGPAILESFERLKIKPELLLFDGQGIAHPRGIGIASHLGVMLNIPTVGCAKSRLIGEYNEPGTKKGNWTYLYHDDKRIGAVLRTRDNVRPLFVSPGHMIDIESSVEIVMHCISRYRIPEPLRRADHLSRLHKTQLSGW